MDESIAAWIAVLDRVSYYELLGVQPDAGADALRRAYQAFAANFHPDAHMHRDADERASVNAIFKRGTEAYRVLADSTLRDRYEEKRTGRMPLPGGSRTAPLPPGTSPTAAHAAGTVASGLTDGSRPSSPSKSNVTGRLEDFVRQPRARPFAQQAEALAKKGEHGKAKLQLKLALNFDPKNEALEAYMKELETLIDLDKKKPYQAK